MWKCSCIDGGEEFEIHGSMQSALIAYLSALSRPSGRKWQAVQTSREQDFLQDTD